MNVAPLEMAFNLSTDSLRRIFIEFGDDERQDVQQSQSDIYL